MRNYATPFIQKSLLIFISIFFAHFFSQAQTINWDMTTAPPTSISPANANLTVSDISHGNNNGTTTLLTTTSVSSGYTGASGTFNAGAACKIGALNNSTSTYFEVTFTPAIGNNVTINGISFGSRSTGTGPQAYSVLCSSDGFTNVLASGVFLNNSTWALHTPTLSTFTSCSGAPITYRIYGHSGTGSPSINTANWRIDDLTFTVSTMAGNPIAVTASVTTPASCTMGGTITANATNTLGASGFRLNAGLFQSTNTFSNIAPGTYTITAMDGSYCSATTLVTVASPVLPTISVTATPSTSVCEGTSLLFNATGTGVSYTWSGGITNNVAFVSSLANTSYTVTASDGGSCTSSSIVNLTVNPMNAVISNATAANASSSPGTDGGSNNQLANSTMHYYSTNACNLILSLANNPIDMGTTNVVVHTLAAVATYNNQPYVPRWFQITPTNNTSATVTLYLTQNDFDVYNTYATANGWPLLPQNPSDATGIANIRITKNDNAGLGVNPIVLTPSSVMWNASNAYWAVTFSTPGFSQFHIHALNPGNAALPVLIKDFAGEIQPDLNLISWTSVQEINNAKYILEYSDRAYNYNTLAEINSLATNGNSQGVLHYAYPHTTAKAGNNYYRLWQQDIDGKMTLIADAINVIRSFQGAIVQCYPNPALDVLQMEYMDSKNAALKIDIVDMLGSIVLSEQYNTIANQKNEHAINIASLSHGLYYVRLSSNGQQVYSQKFLKK